MHRLVLGEEVSKYTQMGLRRRKEAELKHYSTQAYIKIRLQTINSRMRRESRESTIILTHTCTRSILPIRSTCGGDLSITCRPGIATNTPIGKREKYIRNTQEIPICYVYFFYFLAICFLL